MWEEAIILGKELAEQYENEMFDFEQLSASLVSNDIFVLNFNVTNWAFFSILTITARLKCTYFICLKVPYFLIFRLMLLFWVSIKNVNCLYVAPVSLRPPSPPHSALIGGLSQARAGNVHCMFAWCWLYSSGITTMSCLKAWLKMHCSMVSTFWYFRSIYKAPELAFWTKKDTAISVSAIWDL